MCEKLCELSEALADLLYEHINDFESVNTSEAEKITKMIKNLEEAEYYCTIVEAMNNGEDCSKLTVNTASHGSIGVM